MARRWRWFRALRNAGVALLGLGVLATAVFTLAGQVSRLPFGQTCASGRSPRFLAYRAPGHPGIGLAAWTAFEGGPSHNLVLPGSVGGSLLRASWRFVTGGGISAAPSIVNGIVYFASMDHCVYAVDAETGARIWSFHADNGLMSEPLVAEDRVFAGSGGKAVVQVHGVYRRGTGPSSIYALDAHSGRMLWRYRTPGENMPTQLFSGRTVYAATGNATFYALDSTTGRLEWQLPVGSIDSMSSPALWGDIAVFGGAKPYTLFGVNLRTGRLAWSLPLPLAEGGVDDVSVAIADGVAYVQVPEGVYPRATVVEWAVDASTGRNLWQTVLGTGNLPAADMEETGVATVVNGVVYVGSPALHGLWALDAQTGRPLWPAPTPLPIGLRASPTVDGNVILAVAQGQLFVVDRQSGALERTVRVGRPVDGSTVCAWPAPVVAGGTVYVVGGAANVVQAIPLANVLSGVAPGS